VRHEPAVLRTRAALRSSLRDLAPGDLVLAAVSGGADSLALAAAAAFYCRKAGLRLGAVTVDHGLQPGSAGQAERAAEQCRELGLDPVVVRRVRVGGRGGPETAARVARYAALDAVADELGAAVILLGHTLDDQAETVLLRLARGSGARSLAGMTAVSGRYRRPFLHLRRTDTQAACRAAGLPPWHDPHNDDPAYARVRVRRDLLRALEDALGPGAAEALARTASLLRDDADALDEWAGKALPDASTTNGLDIPVLTALPRAVRTRVLRAAAIAAGAPAGALSARHVSELERLVTDWHGQGCVSLPGGVSAERRYDRLVLR